MWDLIEISAKSAFYFLESNIVEIMYDPFPQLNGETRTKSDRYTATVLDNPGWIVCA